MGNMIKVTRILGNDELEIWINPNLISMIEPAFGGSLITFADDDNHYISVKETPGQLISWINY